MVLTVYGIPNCDTVKKARRWLTQQQIDHTLHDVKVSPVSAETLNEWLQAVGIDTLVNKRSTSWRNLTSEQQKITSNAEAVALLQAHPTLMKRPVVPTANQILVGFKEAQWQNTLLSSEASA